VDEAKCEACLTCLRICPFDVPVVEDVAVISSDICQACGLCAVECPAKAITIKRFADRGIVDRVVKLMEGGTSAVRRVEMVCAQDAETREELRDRVETIDGIVTAKVPVNCAARVEEVDMMKPFELGAESVVLRRCKECRYPGAEMRLARRVGRTREILDAVGVGGERLILE
jgi:ferredoxin